MATKKEKKLTKTERESLQTFRDKVNAALLELGKIKLQEQNLENNKNNIIGFYKATVEEQNEFLNELQEKYGDGNIDIETGVFTPLSE